MFSTRFTIVWAAGGSASSTLAIEPKRSQIQTCDKKKKKLNKKNKNIPKLQEHQITPFMPKITNQQKLLSQKHCLVTGEEENLHCNHFNKEMSNGLGRRETAFGLSIGYSEFLPCMYTCLCACGFLCIFQGNFNIVFTATSHESQTCCACSQAV